ncbi:leucine-rich repeat protein [Carboxylicivirga linearis]|uniref:Leucine-rich repeat protein n=1 Tax=Carboxylicivirga linearis TaxID=1628157 RepID=A0ABS5K0A3_9BACT|nr:leucine-rich repeat protein [Carboxylicivirga linearis]MBS2100519.1 leucine-rich repeat protein [Carboxylicivirga linearis]
MKFPLITISFFLFVTLFPISAQIDYILQDNDVNIDENGYITDCLYDFSVHEEGTNLTIPEILQGVVVKGINNAKLISSGWTLFDSTGVFQHKKLLALHLPSTLEFVGKKAFYDNRIEKMEIPSKVRKIGFSAFDTNNLTEVCFEENSEITFIGKKAFDNNLDLDSIVLPSKQPNFVKWITDYNTFVPSPYEISNFLSSYLAIIKYTLTDDDVVMNEDGYITSCSYFLGTDIIIPEVLQGKKVRGISYDNDFNEYVHDSFRESHLVSVELPSSIEYIGEYAFAGNILESITIPPSVIEIDNFAFFENELTSIDLSGSLVRIGHKAFYDNELTSVTFSNSLQKIGDKAFCENQLKRVTLPNSVNNIGYSAFSYNYIDSLKLSSSLTKINYSVFSYNELAFVSIPSSVVTLKGGAFSRNRIKKVVFEDDSRMLVIGSGVFASNYDNEINQTLQSIVLPESHKEGCENIGWTDNKGNFYSANLEVNDYSLEYKAEFNPLQTSAILTLLDENDNLLKGVPITITPDSENCIFLDGEGFSAISDAIGVVVMKNLGLNTDCTVNIEAQGYQSELINVRSGRFTDVIFQRQYESVYLVTLVVTDANSGVLEGVDVIVDGVVYTTDCFGKVYLVNQPNGVINYTAIDESGSEIDGTITINGSNVVEEIMFVSTGIKMMNDNAFKVCANPTSDKVIIEINETLITSYELYDINGQLVFSQFGIHAQQVSVNLSSYPGGVYFIKVKTTSGLSQTVKLLKK